MYKYKFKKFLCTLALGMKPDKVWNGMDEFNGGYLVLNENEEIYSYNVNKRYFEEYLLSNTMMDSKR